MRMIMRMMMFQVMQVTYGVATSTEVAYFTYIYAKVYQRQREIYFWEIERQEKDNPLVSV